jgi:hypothetical protein
MTAHPLEELREDAADIINALAIDVLETEYDAEEAWLRLFGCSVAPFWGSRITLSGDVWHCYGLSRYDWSTAMFEYRRGKVTIVTPPGTNAAKTARGALE